MVTENISINIPVEHAAPLIDYYTKRLADIENEIKSINSILMQLKSPESKFISASSSIGSAPEVPVFDDGYNPKWNNPSKAKFFIEKEGRKLSNAEIVDNILKYEPGFDRAKLIGSMSSVLGSKAKDGKEFVREEDEYGNFLYGIIEKKAANNAAINS